MDVFIRNIGTVPIAIKSAECYGMMLTMLTIVLNNEPNAVYYISNNKIHKRIYEPNKNRYVNAYTNEHDRKYIVNMVEELLCERIYVVEEYTMNTCDKNHVVQKLECTW